LIIEAAGSVCVIAGILSRKASAGMSGMNATQFFKNLGMMGGLLMIAVYGPGLWTIDRLWKRPISYT
jgi:uncharacterized membrane protein YphA (DoxX/SURF4 family)